MERICEDRKEYGMNGVEIKWGEIGEVGIILEKMGDNEKVVGGKMKKSMNYWIENMEKLMKKKKNVIEYMVIEEKRRDGEKG